MPTLQIGDQTIEVESYIIKINYKKEQPKPSPLLLEASRKFEAEIMMEGINNRLSIPTREEWIGLNLLIRDDELRR